MAYEILFVIIVIVVQAVVFAFTCFQALRLYQSIPTGISRFELEHSPISTNNHPNAKGDSADSVRIVLRTGAATWVFSNILSEINHYLHKNNGHITDVNHIKEISKRHLSKHESAVKSLVPIPLYLGLLGTISGVVIGLFNIPSLTIDPSLIEASAATQDNLMGKLLSESSELGAGVDKLIEGVKYAMVASFTGLLFTTIGAGWILRSLRLRIDEGSNDLIAFIQAELLPAVSKDLVSSFNDLHFRLATFTSSFTENIQQLWLVIWENGKSIEDQRKTFEAIDKLDIAQIAKFNVEVFKKLKGTVESLDSFNQSVQNIAGVVNSTNDMTRRFEVIASRTENFQKIASDISGNLELHGALMGFLQSHFSELDTRRLLIQGAVEKVDKSLEDSLVSIQDKVNTARKEYGAQSEKHIDFLRAVTIAEEDFLRDEKRRLQEALDNNQNRLGKLDYLEGINKGLSDQFKESQNVNKRLVGLLESLEKGVITNTEELRTIKKASVIYQLQVLYRKLHHRFLSGKK